MSTVDPDDQQTTRIPAVRDPEPEVPDLEKPDPEKSEPDVPEPEASTPQGTADDRQTAIIAMVRVAPPVRMTEPASTIAVETPTADPPTADPPTPDPPTPDAPTADPVTSDDGAKRSPKLSGLVSPRVVVLRPDRVDENYRSVHSALTRTNSRSVARAIARVATEALVTFGLVAILFAGYEVWGRNGIVDAHQQELDQQLSQDWADEPGDPVVAPLTPPPSSGPSSTPGAAAAPPPKPTVPPPGNAVARMYIPRLDKYWVIVEGVQPADLKYSPGHYPGTAKAGQVGNFSVAGHRIPAMFWDLDDMRSGDPIVLETANTWYVYKVTQLHVTGPTAVEVVAPVPGRPGANPVAAMLTITTCEPKWDNAKRLVVHAQLSRQQPRSAGRPKEAG